MLPVFFFLSILFHIACAHSWVECTDYDPASFDYDKLGTFDRARCRGYPRAFQRQFDAGFSRDTGYNWEHPLCTRDPFNSNDYSGAVNMARYSTGQIIYISHPAKNHVADSCTNPFIPSGVLEVRMSSAPDVDTFDVSLPMIGGDHVNGVIDHLEYQRCYQFCSDMDGSHCLTAWQLPTDIADGRHSFLWVWEFNQGQFYSNCFDAIIGNNGTTMSPTTAPPVSTTPPSTPSTTTMLPLTPSPNNTAPSSSGSEDTTIEVPPSPMPSSTMNESTDSPPSTTNDAKVISNGGHVLINPIGMIHSYLMNISGVMNISALFNITSQ